MRLNFLILPIFLLSLLGCASSQPVEKEPPKPEITQSIEKEATSPDWYNPAIDYYIENNTMFCVGTASAMSREKAAVLAEISAKANLKKLIDLELEEARIQLAESTMPDAANREFIVQLRNTVNNLTFGSTETDIEFFERKNGAIVAYVRESVTFAEVKAILENSNVAGELINSL